jgi:hypothetical protein
MQFLMRQFQRQLGQLLRVGFSMTLCFFQPAYAGIIEGIKRMNTDTLTWHVHVVDKQGSVVPAVTIWRLIPDGQPSINTELMQRLVHRYGKDADFVQHDVHPNLLVNYSDKEGEFIHSDVVSYHKSPEVITIYAVIKKGYLPKVVSDVALKNTTHELKIVLDSDPAARPDLRMLQFDLIRAEAYIPAANAVERMQENRGQTIELAQQKLRVLAQTLEKERQYDLASAIYYNLAYLPSVDTVRRADGQELIFGYTNGYESSNERRKADMDRALELNRSNPNLLLKRLRKNYGNEDLKLLPLPELEAYLQKVEEFISANPERIWPTVSFLQPQYQRLKMYDKACMALRRSYRFEPTFLSQSLWNISLDELNKKAAAASYRGAACVLEP